MQWAMKYRPNCFKSKTEAIATPMQYILSHDDMEIEWTWHFKCKSHCLNEFIKVRLIEFDKRSTANRRCKNVHDDQTHCV